MLCKCLQTHQKKGGALKRSHCKRVLVTTWKQAAYKLSGAISSLSSFKRVPGPRLRQHSTCSNRQHYSDVIHKQGRSGPLCALLSWPGVPGKKMTLKARHIPDRLNVMADKLGQTIQTEWSLLPEVLQAIYRRWHWPQIDLFATRFNNKLPLCHYYQIPWPQQWTHSVCHGRIWTHTPSHQQPYWAKWWRSCRTPHAIELFWLPWDGLSGHIQSNPTEHAQCAQPVNTALQSDPSQESDKPKSPCMAPRRLWNTWHTLFL